MSSLQAYYSGAFNSQTLPVNIPTITSTYTNTYAPTGNIPFSLNNNGTIPVAITLPAGVYSFSFSSKITSQTASDFDKAVIQLNIQPDGTGNTLWIQDYKQTTTNIKSDARLNTSGLISLATETSLYIVMNSNPTASVGEKYNATLQFCIFQKIA